MFLQFVYKCPDPSFWRRLSIMSLWLDGYSLNNLLHSLSVVSILAMSGCNGGMSWSVDIEAIPPPAPGWDTGWGEEGGKCEVLKFYKCEKCGRKF
jgi:hypothetical protein